MADHDITEATVVLLPEAHAHPQVRLPGAGVEAGVGGHPALPPVGQGQLLKALQPEGASLWTELAAGLGASATAAAGGAAQGVDQILLMVAPQPDRAAAVHQAPDPLHRGRGVGAAVDGVAAKNQTVACGQLGEELLEGARAAVHITDHPVAGFATDARHIHHFGRSLDDLSAPCGHPLSGAENGITSP